MDRDAAIRLLPTLHANALRLRDQGLRTASIAERLDLGLDEVDPVLRIAEAKLRRLITNISDSERDEE